MSLAQSYQISGRVSDAESGELLPIATIYNTNSMEGCSSNAYGAYCLSIKQGKQSITYSFVGYQSKTLTINIVSDTVINIELTPGKAIDEVIISAEKDNVLNSTQLSCHNISAKQVEKLPSLFGESDIIESVRSLPGIHAGAQGSAGIVVRGSNPDQTLVLFDGVPIYNANHLDGYYSVFNTDAIAQSSMHKGAYPAHYGERIAGVLDVRMREGNNQQFKGKISIGTIVSKITLEGPIIKDKLSYILSFRQTYANLLTLPIQKVVDGEAYNYGFNDYNAKLNYKINDKHQVYLSGYMGRDRYKYTADLMNNAEAYDLMKWGNAFVSARWNYNVSPKLFMHTKAYGYRYGLASQKYSFSPAKAAIDSNENIQDIRSENIINDYSISTEVDYFVGNNNTIKFGLGYIYHELTPNKYSFNYRGSNDAYNGDFELVNIKYDYSIPIVFSHERFAFIEDNYSITENIKLNAGLRYSNFTNQQHTEHFLMPRLAMNYKITNYLSLKAAYGHYCQYAFLATNPAVGLPTDTWLQSVDGLKPMLGKQAVFGVYTKPLKRLFFETELFYKITDNANAYKEMVPFDLFASWADIFEQGQNTAYGFECMVNYQTPRMLFNVSYAYIRSIQNFEGLNNGAPFYHTFDAPHNINTKLVYNINENINLGVNWVVASGKRITLVEQQYTTPTNFESDYSYIYDNEGFITAWESTKAVTQRNNHRLPAYHRLDFGANFSKDKKRGRRTWSFGIYNVYNRKNTLYLEESKEGYSNYSMTSIVPYFAYSFQF